MAGVVRPEDADCGVAAMFLKAVFDLWHACSALPESKRTEALAHPRAPTEADVPQTQARASAGRSYPRGTRLLFWLHRRTGLGIHELYVFRPVRWAVNLLDR